MAGGSEFSACVCALFRSREECPDVVVGGLSEVAVPLTDGGEATILQVRTERCDVSCGPSYWRPARGVGLPA